MIEVREVRVLMEERWLARGEGGSLVQEECIQDDLGDGEDSRLVQ